VRYSLPACDMKPRQRQKVSWPVHGMPYAGPHDLCFTQSTLALQVWCEQRAYAQTNIIVRA